MKNKKTKKIYKRLFVLIIFMYVILTLSNQQKTLNKYSRNIEDLSKQIESQKEYKEELAKKKDDVDSLEYIEQVAREQLDMYYPNENIYIDSGM